MIRCSSFLGSGLLSLWLTFAAAPTPVPSKLPQAPDQLSACWQDLAADDAGQAYRAMWQLAKQPAPAVKLLEKQLTPAAPPDADKMQNWLADLNSPKFAIRDKAFKELEKLAELAEPALIKVLSGKPDLETRQRIDLLLARLQTGVRSPEKLQMLRAVEVLEMIGTDQAKDLLQRLSKGFDAHRQTQEAQATLHRLKQRPPFKGWPAVDPKVAGDPLPFGARVRFGTTVFRHRYYPRSGVSFSPDSQFLASIDGMDLYIWETQTGKLVRKSHHDALCIATSPKGTVVALGLDIGNLQQSAIVLWDWREQKVLARMAPPSGVTPRRLGFTPDGSQLLSQDSDQRLRFWDLKTLKVNKVWAPPNPKDDLTGFSPDGPLVIVMERKSGNSYLHDLRKETKVLLEGLEPGSDGRAFSPDAQYVATSTYDHVGLRIFEVASGKLWRIQGSGAAPSSGPCAFSPDGKVLARGGRESAISLWEAKTGKFLKTLTASSQFDVAAISPDSRWLAATRERCLRIWNLETGQPVGDGDGHIEQIHSLVFSPRFDAIATCSDDGSVRLWDPITGKQKHCLFTDGRIVRGLAFSPDGQWLASSDFANSVRLWEVAKGRQVYKLAGHGSYGGKRIVAWSADGRHLLSWGDDFYMRQWDVKTAKALLEHRTRPTGLDFPANEDEDDIQRDRVLEDRLIFAAAGAFTPGADQFILASGTGQLHFFDVATGKEKRVVKLGVENPNTLAVSPNGKHLVVASYGFHLGIYDLASGKALFSIALPGDYGTAQFSDDGRTIAAASGTRIVLVEVATGKFRLSMDKLPGQSRAVTFSPDGRLLVSGMEDTTALVWDLALLAAKEARR
jgi:WD40 repeat protein